MAESCKIFTSCSTVLKCCGILLGVVIILHCIGIGTDYWVKTDTNGYRLNSGLWKHCMCFSYGIYSSTDTCYCFSSSGDVPGWFKGVQALEIIGLILIVIVGFMVLMQLFFTRSIDIKIWGILLILLSGTCILAGVILYGAKIIHHLNFSFGLCTVAGILCLLCGFLLFQDRNIARRVQQSSAGQPYNVQYANQGRVILPPQTTTVVSFTNTPGYPPPYANAQYGPPPSYTYVQQQGQQMQPYNVQQSYPAAT